MKTLNRIVGSMTVLSMGAALLLAAGCSKQEQPAADTTKTVTPAASQAPKPVSSTQAAPAAESVKPAESPAATPVVETPKAAEVAPTAPDQAKAAVTTAAQEAMRATANQATNSVAAANSQVQTLIEKAKGLVTDQKYKDALTVVQQLSGMTLTPEQRSLVDGLKTQIQTALAKNAASDASSALGNILGGKK